jgi:transposase-like protein
MAKSDGAPLTKAELEALKNQGRRAYDEETINQALRYLIKNQCSVAAAAAEFGMSAQTLTSYRRKYLEAAGLIESSEE